ncbi:MAG: methyl-coenzyme M reductase glutamine C-methyltransferase [Candidatus Helarchaeota archaeon]
MGKIKQEVTIYSPDGIYAYGAMVIAGILENAGYTVRLTKNYTVEGAANSEIIGFSLSSTLHLVGATADLVQKLKRRKNPFIMVGGPISLTPELVFSCLPQVDAVIVGEGEETVRELVEAVRFKRDLDSIAGIAFKSGEKVKITEPRAPYNLENAPIPKIPPEISEQSVRGANAYFETHRGCLAGCAFCLIPKLFGQRHIRSKTIPQIRREVRAFVMKGAVRLAISSGNIALYGMKDHQISEDKVERMLATVSSIITPMNFAAPDLRVDMIPDRVLQAVRDYTYGLVIFGMESGSDSVLKLMKKGITVQKIEEAIQRCEKIGLSVAGAFITGYPGETEAYYEETKEFIESHALADYSVSLPEPIPGTELARTILNLPEKKNPVFIQDETKLGKKYGFTIAERRCFELLLASSTSRKLPLFLTDRLIQEFVKLAKDQGREIRKMTQILKTMR